jgi:hypothetical protein
VECLAESEVPLRAGNVETNLRAECFWRFEVALRADAPQEGHLQGCLLAQVNGFEVEQVCFDSEGVCAKGGAVSDVGDAVEEA